MPVLLLKATLKAQWCLKPWPKLVYHFINCTHEAGNFFWMLLQYHASRQKMWRKNQPHVARICTSGKKKKLCNKDWGPKGHRAPPLCFAHSLRRQGNLFRTALICTANPKMTSLIKAEHFLTDTTSKGFTIRNKYSLKCNTRRACHKVHISLQMLLGKCMWMLHENKHLHFNEMNQTFLTNMNIKLLKVELQANG